MQLKKTHDSVGTVLSIGRKYLPVMLRKGKNCEQVPNHRIETIACYNFTPHDVLAYFFIAI